MHNYNALDFLYHLKITSDFLFFALILLFKYLKIILLRLSMIILNILCRNATVISLRVRQGAEFILLKKEAVTQHKRLS